MPRCTAAGSGPRGTCRQESRQVAAAHQGGHMVRVGVGELDVATEVDRETGLHEAVDRRGRRPQNRQRHPQRLVSFSVATPTPIGPRSAARTCSASAASTTSRDHKPRPASADGTRPQPVAHRQAANGTRNRPAAAYSS
ncbi:hypothetical protein [Streptomyces cirratus]|uniref:hypothetical protein n=1 Tax=Streptomyces cirratus TaxID=68187 RepID=UPI003605CC36